MGRGGEGHVIHVRASDNVVTANAHSKTAFLWSWLKNGGTVRTRSLRGMSGGGRQWVRGRLGHLHTHTHMHMCTHTNQHAPVQ